LVEVVEVTDEVMRRLPAEIDPQREEFEIKVVPEEPDEVITVEAMNARMKERAREAAWQHYMQTCTGVWLPLPDLRSWPERYRRAFEDELARLRARRS
jgi:hypothetical protein